MTAVLPKYISLCTVATTLPDEDEKTAFSRLSGEAQDLIVRALLGEFDEETPGVSNEVRSEIENWCLSEYSEGNVTDDSNDEA